jgi:ABC-type phosphate transport system substrate-binding protein
MFARYLFIAVMLIGQGWVAGSASADVVVIVNRESTIAGLSTSVVSDLYLGRLRSLPNGAPAIPIDRKFDSPLRERFFRLLNGMSARQVNTYWARLQFSGQVLPPPSLDDDKAVISALRGNPAAIGYIDASSIDASVRIVLHLKDG